LDVTAHRAEHLELCAGYALGALDPADRAALEAHLEGGCPECEAELHRLAGAVRRLAASAPPRPQPAALRARVLAAAAETAPGRSPSPRPLPLPRPRRRSSAHWAWAALAAAFAIATALAWTTAERLRGELATTRTKLDGAQRALADARRWMALLDSPTARTVSLTPTPQGLGLMRARATFDPATHRAVIVFENVATPAASDFQLWALRSGGVASLGLVRADAAGRAIVRIEDAGDPTALAGFAVSLERLGGSPRSDAPEGPVVLAGKFGS
jgi:anti-sigma-K factor RskA